jgi:hypothetical protein
MEAALLAKKGFTANPTYPGMWNMGSEMPYLGGNPAAGRTHFEMMNSGLWDIATESTCV